MADALSVNWVNGLLDIQPSVQVEIELSRWLLAAVRIYCVRLFRRSHCLPAQDLRLGSEQRHPKLDSGDPTCPATPRLEEREETYASRLMI
ncbi:hypothetical protein C8034_v002701 [Colletotrichum sidae]|uniref:Uncharacterized protein n=1 Tax=Colletotrichum sidae TaxID=1347389 RepID=A0A4R8TBY9_9PEZI|nr:hypothetical protein C8034_v002701 [Colletotrichum sidae]